MALTKTKKLPKPALFTLPTDLPYTIKKIVPSSPRIIPAAILFFMGSFVNNADKTSTIIGVHTMITAADIGEVKLNPLKKVSILKATPKKAAATILGKSATAMFSLGIKSQVNQNNTTEPPTRNKIKP